MKGWIKLSNYEDPLWVEWHKEIMHPTKGRVMLKVFRSYCGAWKASTTKPNGERSIMTLKSQDAESAKREALKLCCFKIIK